MGEFGAFLMGVGITIASLSIIGMLMASVDAPNNITEDAVKMGWVFHEKDIYALVPVTKP